MNIFNVTYLRKNGTKVNVLVARTSGYQDNNLNEQVADTDTDFAEVISCLRIVDNEVVFLSECK